MKLILDTPTHQIRVPDDAVVGGPPRIIDQAEFFQRFPVSVIDAMLASNTPAAKSFLLRMRIVAEVNLDSPQLIVALNRMVPAILTAQERTDVLA